MSETKTGTDFEARWLRLPCAAAPLFIPLPCDGCGKPQVQGWLARWERPPQFYCLGCFDPGRTR